MFHAGGVKVNILPKERCGDSPADRTSYLPIERGTIRRRPNEMLVANAYMSCDVPLGCC